jgi:WD40 repeat protein
MAAPKPDEATIINAALRIDDPAARRRYVAEACGNDLALAGRVEGLLRAHHEAPTFLGSPTREPGDLLGAVSERDIFHTAAAFTNAAERAAYLDEACAGNTSLRQHVEDMLQLLPELGAFLEAPAIAREGAPSGYELLGELGRGGMGVVYKARQVGLNRLVALKMVLAGSHAGPEELARFRTEAEAVAALQHPNIVQIYEVGESDGLPFFSLELVEGGSLADRLTGTPWAARPAAELVATLARTMHYAHSCGIVHRDLKPANVLLAPIQIADCRLQIEEMTADGSSQSAILNLQSAIPKVTDFGIAKLINSAAGRTRTGDVMGTPSYMAPEQASGRTREIGPAADVYALGAILCELLTGRPPFRAESAMETLFQVIAKEPVPLSQLVPRLPRDLETICLKCLEKEPTRRYESAAALADDLQRFLEGKPILARPVPAWERLAKWARRRPAVAALTAATVTVALVGFGLVLWQWLRAEAARQEATQTAEAEKQARGRAEQAEGIAEQRRQEAEKALREVRTSLYFNSITLADREWQAGHVAGAEELLDACPADLRAWDWHYLKRRCHAERLTCSGHTNLVTGVAYSPDGKRLASSSRDQTVRVWDAGTGKELLKLEGHSGAVGGVAWSPDGKRIASVRQHDPFQPIAELAKYAELKLWDAATGKELLTLPGLFGVAFSPDGRRVASAGTNRTIKVWDVDTGQQVFSLSGHQNPPVNVAWSGDGRLLASASFEFAGSKDDRVKVLTGNLKPAGEVKLWDAAMGKETFRVRGPVERATSLALSPDGQRLSLTHFSGLVTVWDTARGQLLYTLRGRNSTGEATAFSPDGRLVAAVGTRLEPARFWDTASGMEVLTLRGVQECLAFSPDRRHVATGWPGCTVKVWDLDTGQDCLRLRSDRSVILNAALSPDGRRLASLDNDYHLKVWDTADGRVIFSRPCKAVRVVFHPDGKRLATAGADAQHPEQPGAITIWDAATGKELKRLPGGYPTMMISLAYSPDGRRLVSSGCNAVRVDQPGSVKLQDAETGRELWSLPSSHHVVSVAFSPDGRRIALGVVDKSVRVLDPDTGRELLALKSYAAPVRCVCFSPDGQQLASGTYAGNLHVHDAVTGQELFAHKGHDGMVFDLAYSPDSRRLATVTFDGCLNKSQVKFWDAGSGKQVLSLPGVLTVTFSGDGRLLATAGWKSFQPGELRVWNATPQP